MVALESHATHRPQQSERRIDHNLEAALDVFAHIPRRHQLQTHPTFLRHRATIMGLLEDFEWSLGRAQATSPAQPGRVRAVAWNIERGKRFVALRERLRRDTTMRRADLMMLTEVDLGMGRSQNRNVARELAETMDMGYVYANHHVVLSPGDHGEQGHHEPNTLALHGSALLSRFPITRFDAVTLPEYVDKFHAFEKRLGDKRALFVEVQLPDGPLTVAVIHLDPFAPPRYRVVQMRLALNALARFGGQRVLLGGDLNTHTFDLSTGRHLMTNLARRLVRFGLEQTIEHFMRPQDFFERDLFALVQSHGFEIDPWNDLDAPTLYFRAHDPELVTKTLAYMPSFIRNRAAPRLDPWEGKIPTRLDWYAGRNLIPLAPAVIDEPAWEETIISDHNPVIIDIALKQDSTE